MSAATPNLDAFRQQSDTALAALLDAGTADATIANLIEAVHGLARRVELLEHPLYVVNVASDGTTTVNPAGGVTAIPTETTPEPAAEEVASDGISPETPA